MNSSRTQYSFAISYKPLVLRSHAVCRGYRGPRCTIPIRCTQYWNLKRRVLSFLFHCIFLLHLNFSALLLFKIWTVTSLNYNGKYGGTLKVLRTKETGDHFIRSKHIRGATLCFSPLIKLLHSGVFLSDRE